MTSKFQRLTDAELDRIFQKFVKDKHRVVCDEYHAHGFDCVEFDDEQTMIIDRLRVEVIMLRDKLKQVEEILKK